MLVKCTAVSYSLSTEYCIYYSTAAGMKFSCPTRSPPEYHVNKLNKKFKSYMISFLSFGD
jgi:hypothetical protein